MDPERLDVHPRELPAVSEGLVAGGMDPMGMLKKNAYKAATGASIDASDPEVIRTSQGVTTGPKGPGDDKAAFIADQLRRGKDQATAQRMADQIFGK